MSSPQISGKVIKSILVRMFSSLPKALFGLWGVFLQMFDTN